MNGRENAETHSADMSGEASLIRVEAEKFRAELVAGRSMVFLRLFDFLLAHSSDERAPKLIEIATAILEKETTIDGSGDSAARAYVHRLRRRLDDFYAGKSGPRLSLLKGEYRIVLSNGASSKAADSPSIPPLPVANKKRRRFLLCFVSLLAPAVLIAIWAAFSIHAPRPPLPEAGKTIFWRAVTRGDRSVLVVVGDYYLLAESENRKDVKRLILDPAIQSRDDLDAYLLKRPEAFYQLYDLDLHYTPAATAKAVGVLLPFIGALHPEEPDLKTSSRLVTGDIKSRDIIYVGDLGGLGMLGDTLSQASNFKIAPEGKELIDNRSGTRYAVNKDASDGRTPQFDYGYIASLPEPSGGRLLVVSGLSEEALAQMTELATNKQQLDLAADRAGNNAAFEALYEVRTTGAREATTSLVTAAPLHGRDGEKHP